MIFRHRLLSLLLVLQMVLAIHLMAISIDIVAEHVVKVSRSSGIADSFYSIHMQPYHKHLDLNELVESDLGFIRSYPGVDFASSSYALPMSDRVFSSFFYRFVVSEQGEKDINAVRAYFFGVDTDGANALGLKIRAGRNFYPSELYGSEYQPNTQFAKAMITQTLALELFSGESALGRYFSGVDGPVFEVIAVLDDFIAEPQSPYGKSAFLAPDTVVRKFRYYWLNVKSENADMLVDKLREQLVRRNDKRSVGEPVSISQQQSRVYERDFELIKLFSSVIVLLTVLCAFSSYAFAEMHVHKQGASIALRYAMGASKKRLVRDGISELGLLLFLACLLSLLVYLVLRFSFEEFISFSVLYLLSAACWVLAVFYFSVFPVVSRSIKRDFAQSLRWE